MVEKLTPKEALERANREGGPRPGGGARDLPGRNLADPNYVSTLPHRGTFREPPTQPGPSRPPTSPTAPPSQPGNLQELERTATIQRDANEPFIETANEAGLSQVEIFQRQAERGLKGRLPDSFIIEGTQAVADMLLAADAAEAADLEQKRLTDAVASFQERMARVQPLTTSWWWSEPSSFLEASKLLRDEDPDAEPTTLQRTPAELKAIADSKTLAFEASAALSNARFKTHFWTAFPAMWESGDYETFEDAIKFVLGEESIEGIPNEDLRQMEAWWSEITSIIQPRPGADDLEAIADLYIQRPRAKFTNLDSMTTAEIQLALASRSTISIPAGMTREMVLEALREHNSSPEMVEELESSRAYYEEIALQYQNELLETLTYQTGLLNPDLPTLTGWQHVQLVLTQPTLATTEAMETWFRHTTMPWAAWLIRSGNLGIMTGISTAAVTFAMTGRPAIAAATGLLGAGAGGYTSGRYKSELSQIYEAARLDGHNWYMANTVAYEEWGSPLAIKIMIETVADPTTLWGTGLVGRAFPLSTRGVKGGFTAARRVSNRKLADLPGPLRQSLSSGYALGTSFGAFENGFIRFTDAAFRQILPTQAGIFPILAGGGAAGLTFGLSGRILPAVGLGLAAAITPSQVYRRLPRTINQVANHRAMDLIQRLRAVSSARFQQSINDPSASGSLVRAVPSDFIRRTADEAIAIYLRNPDQAHLNKFALLGKELYDSANIYAGFSDVAQLARDLNVNFAVGQNRPMVAAFEGGVVRWTDNTLAEFNQLLFTRPGNKGFLSEPEHARLIAQMFGKTDEDSVNLAIEWLRLRRATIIQQATAPLQVASPRQALQNMSRQVIDTTEANARGPVARIAYQDGMNVGTQKWIERTAKWTMANWIEANLVYPFSRSVLLFLNYGPFNVLENGIRTGYAGINPFPVRGIDHIVHVSSLWDDTFAYPVAMSRQALGDAVTAPGPMMAVPRDATESIFGMPNVVEGNIPGVTESIGHFVGKFGSLGRMGERGINKVLPSYLQSLANWNEIFSKVGAQQQAWYLNKRATRELQRLAPDHMEQIGAAIAGFGSGFKGDISSKHMRALVMQLQDYAIKGPTAVRGLQNTPLIFKQKQLAAAMNEVFEEYTNLEPVIKDAIINGVISGDITLNNMAQKMIGARAAHLELSSIERATHHGALLKDAFAQFSNVNPTNTEELFNQIRNLEFLSESIVGDMGTISTMLQTATVRGHGMGHEARRQMHTRVLNNMADLSATLDSGLRQQARNFHEQIAGAPEPGFSMDDIEIENPVGKVARGGKDGLHEIFVMDKNRFGRTMPGETTVDSFGNSLIGDYWEQVPVADGIKEIISQLPRGVQGRIKRVQWSRTSPQGEGPAAGWNPEDGTLTLHPLDDYNDITFQDIRRRAQAIELLDDMNRGDLTGFYEIAGTEEFRTAYLHELSTWPEPATIDVPRAPGPRQTGVATFDEGYDSVIVEATLKERVAYEGVFPPGTATDSAIGSILDNLYSTDLNRLTMPPEAAELLDKYLILSMESKLEMKAARAVQQQGHDIVFEGGDSKRYNEWFGVGGKIEHAMDAWKLRHRVVTSQLRKMDRDIAKAMGLSTRPVDIRHPAFGRITSSDVAFLYANGAGGGNVDDMVKNMIDHTTMTMKTKTAFVQDHHLQAQAAAQELGQTAEDFGFTEEALGEVYDDLMRTLSFNPETAAFDTPMTEMWRGIEMDATWALQGAGVNPLTASKLNSQYEEAAQLLEQLPIFRNTILDTTAVQRYQQLPAESKVRDALGRPRIMSHGTANHYEWFEGRMVSRSSLRVPGFWFAEEASLAERYSRRFSDRSLQRTFDIGTWHDEDPPWASKWSKDVYYVDDITEQEFLRKHPNRAIRGTGLTDIRLQNLDPSIGLPQTVMEADTDFTELQAYIRDELDDVPPEILDWMGRPSDRTTISYYRDKDRLMARVSSPDWRNYRPQVKRAYLDIRNPFDVVNPTDEMWDPYIREILNSIDNGEISINGISRISVALDDSIDPTRANPHPEFQAIKDGFALAIMSTKFKPGTTVRASQLGDLDASLMYLNDPANSIPRSMDERVQEMLEPILATHKNTSGNFGTTDASRLFGIFQEKGFSSYYKLQLRQTILKRAGFDGVHHFGEMDGNVWIAFNAEQIMQPGGPDDSLQAFLNMPDESPWWKQQREDAMEGAVVAMRQDFPDYTSQNAFDAGMRWVYPFWVYEQNRFPWIVKHMVQKPGFTSAWGRYNENSDAGYIPMPGTDLQMNPLRGTVFAGGVRRLYQQDYQEFADQMGPGPSWLDYGSRYGYFPGAQFAFPISEFGGLKSQRGELLPPVAQTLLGTMTAIAPDSDWSKFLNQIVFPDRFRDFNIQRRAIGNGDDGAQILAKINNGISLTEAEEKAWARARRQVAVVSATLDAQVGIFRLRPAEQVSAYEAMAEGREFLTGVSVKQQEQERKYYSITGERFSDNHPMDPLSQYVLREGLEKWQDWLRPNIAPLLPSRLGALQSKIQLYYSDQEKIWEDARTQGFYTADENSELVLTHESLDTLEERWTSGLINTDDYLGAVKRTLERAIIASEQLSQTIVYKDVPKTRKEREDFWEEFNIPQPTFSAGQELLWEYYLISPETKPDEFGIPRIDWDLYFLRIENIFDAMGELARPRLLARMQIEWTPSQVLHWTVNKSHLRPYKNVSDAVANRFTPEEQAIIERFRRADPPEKARLRALELGGDSDTPGRGVISTYESQTQIFRENLRDTDPELDAWLLFWGEVDTVKTAEAVSIYNGLIRQHRPGAEQLEL